MRPTIEERSHVSRANPHRALVAAALMILGAGALLAWSRLAPASWWGWGPGRLLAAAPAVRAEPRPISPRGGLTPDETRTIELFRAASPSVVFITTTAVEQDFFSLRLYETPTGSGSGFIWDDGGHIVTNFHVIERANRARVTLADQSSYDAEVVGIEPHKDLAVLRIDAPSDQLTPLPIGTSADLAVGQKVLAIGNPFGLDHTLTTGVISALGREIQSVTQRPIQGVIQTDAAINPGNSGGPLLDSAGRLIGINTAIYSPSGAYAGVGFAVPVDTVNRIVPQLIRYGKVARPGLGVELFEDHVVRRLARRVPALAGGGVLVHKVARGSAAARAGIQPTTQDFAGQVHLGDLIVAIDDQRVRSTDDLFRALDLHEIGDTVTVTVIRDGSERRLRVELQAIE